MAITTATSQRTTNNTTSVVTMPASVASGDMLLALLAEDSGAVSNTWNNSFVELLDSASATGIICAAAYLIAGGSVTDVTATHTSERSNHIAFRIPAADWANDGTAPQISTIATGSSVNPNATAVAPAWHATHGSIFVVVAFWDDSAAPTISTYPTNYGSNNVTNVTATSAGGIAAASRTVTTDVSSEDPGQFALSGTETWGAVVIAVKGAALAGGYNGSPGNATVAVTGQTPTVAVSDHKVVSPANASIAVTGQTPTVAVNTILTPAVASIAITGQTSTVTATDNKVVSPAAASIALTGQTPTVAVSDHKVVTPTAASVLITGQTPTANVGTNLAPSLATVVVTGQTPTVVVTDHKVVSPAKADVVVSTSTPTVAVNTILTPPPATIAVTTSTPTVTVGGNTTLTPAAAIVTITGSVPTISGPVTGGRGGRVVQLRRLLDETEPYLIDDEEAILALLLDD